ncbi:heterokaryon incompatibility protein-domain-containing protein [Hypoxylon rubiginosum]|uniref:Heterokaryon incompatibility protein-domain-containing protein n=1 Tax=Hypoxylon rubiginosum TaxID=110542 RepID=A0ACB9YRK4_9PEZI|nr:heterokaryon incompatibility protein-domain-containing protein [Hypoxylon rubiginosum]
MYSFGYETYTYPRSLTLRRIRLIKLLPPARSVWPPFRFIPRVQLVEYDLDPLEDPIPPFEALSYTWNTRYGEKPSWPIIVETAGGAQELLIYKNLFLALQSLWNSQLTTLPIFADQICINQHNIPERNFHVALMGELYSRCSRVIVWLGPATTRSDELFEFAKTIGSEATVLALLTIPPQERLRLMDAIVNRTCSEDDELFNVVERFEPKFPIAGYADVLNRGWFGRLWIIQEASLAPEGILLCGDKSFTFDDFRALYFFHSVSCRVWSSKRSKAISATELRLRDSIFQLEQPFVRIFGERMAIHRINQRRSLYELVKKYNVNEDDTKMGATEPEDRIFGLLGLAELDGTAPRTDIGNPKGVYTEFATEIIRRDPDILCFARGAKRLNELPSWVPDWSMSQINIPYGYTTLTSEPIYKAGGSLSDNHPRVDTNGLLKIPGVMVGKVLEFGEYEIKLEDEPLTINNYDFSSLTGFFGEIDAFLEKSSTISGAYNQYTRDEDARLEASLNLTDGGLTARQFPNSNSEYPPLKGLRDELRRFSDRIVRDQETTATYTSFSRTFNKHRPLPGPWVRAFPALSAFQLIFSAFDVTFAVTRFWLYLKMQPIRRRLAGVPAVAPDATDPNGIVDMELHRNTKMFEYKANLFRHHGRKLYLTDGGLVGLGPTDIATGDVVVIIPGGSVPHIVRPSNSSAAQGPDVDHGNAGWADQDKLALDCTYIGEAYCHGAMDGELMAPGVQECILRIS